MHGNYENETATRPELKRLKDNQRTTETKRTTIKDSSRLENYKHIQNHAILRTMSIKPTEPRIIP